VKGLEAPGWRVYENGSGVAEVTVIDIGSPTSYFKLCLFISILLI